MAQRPKPEVRAALLKAAAAAFAERGVEGTSLGDVVARAGTSIGNLYKYFANKDELFSEFIPREFTAELSGRVRAQIEALRSETDVFALEAGHPYLRAAEELLSFTLEHRERVAFLLLRAEGTRHERFAGELVQLLVQLALGHAATAFPTFTATPAHKRALRRIYEAFLACLGSILAEERTDAAVREAVALEARYHLAGLKAFFLSPPPLEVPRCN